MSASAVKFNKLPIILAVLVLSLLLGLGITQCSGRKTVTTMGAEAPEVPTPAIPSKPSDVDGSEETLRTLAVKLGAVTEVAAAQKQQQAKLDALSQTVAEANANDSSGAMLSALQQLQAQNTALTERLLALETRQATPADAVSGADFGLPPGAVPGQLGALDGSQLAAQAPPTLSPGYSWIRPLDRPLRVDANGVPIPESTVPGVASVPGEIEPITPTQIASATPNTRVSTPRFTLPVNATLLDNTAMTAFIGRLPVNGSLPDPYRFKVLASADGLATNGYRLPPEIKGMVFSGTASGDWNLSCVRGNIDSVTFTYDDGSVQTYGGEVALADGNQSATQRRSLGYLSNAAGVPCIKGERVSNAPKVLGARFAAAAFEATARGYAEAQTTSTVTGTGGVVRTIDDAANFGAYTGLAGGASDTKSWLDARLSQIFDAVYAPPGAKVAIHIEAQINLDQRSDARKLAYRNRDAQARALD
jgi:integrating conjugative element protein (TIGR03752 family)